MSYSLDIGPFKPLSWERLFAELRIAFTHIVGVEIEMAVCPSRIANGKEIAIHVSADSQIPNEVASYILHTRIGALKDAACVIVARGFLRQDGPYDWSGLHATVDLFSGSSPLAYVLSACTAVALAELCESQISDSGSNWVLSEWTQPRAFIEAIRSKGPAENPANAIQEVYDNLACNRREKVTTIPRSE